MVRVEWNVNTDVDSSVIYPNVAPACVRWFSPEFKDFFVKTLEKKVRINGMELIHLYVLMDYKYKASTNISKQVIEYSVIASIVERKGMSFCGNEKGVRVTIHSETINLAKLNKMEKIKYLCGLANNITNNIVMLGRAGLMLESKTAPVIKVKNFRHGNEKYVNFVIDGDYFKMTIRKHNKGEKRKPDVWVSIVSVEEGVFSRKKVGKVIDSVLKVFKLIDWSALEPLQIISQNTKMNPETMIEKVGKVLHVFGELANSGALGLNESKIKIYFYNRTGYRQLENKDYVWEEGFTVWTNAFLKQEVFKNQIIEKDEYCGETGTVFTV